MNYLQGGVELFRADGNGWRPALTFLPLVEGDAVRAQTSGRAEIELECGSLLRLDHDSELRLTRLALDPDGGRETTATLARGHAWLNLHNHDGDHFRLQFAGGELTAMVSAARVEVNLDAAAPASVRVFTGSATVHFGPSQLTVKRGEQLQLTPGQRLAAAPAGPRDAWGDWNLERDEPAPPVAAAAGARGGRPGLGTGGRGRAPIGEPLSIEEMKGCGH